jgi:hypothetical protein
MLPPGAKPARIYPWSPANRAVYSVFGAAALADPLVKKINPDFFVLPSSVASARNMARIRDAYPAARFVLWTPREPWPPRNEALKRALASPETARHIEAVITNHPYAMREMLHKNPRPPKGPAA